MISGDTVEAVKNIWGSALVPMGTRGTIITVLSTMSIYVEWRLPATQHSCYVSASEITVISSKPAGLPSGAASALTQVSPGLMSLSWDPTVFSEGSEYKGAPAALPSIRCTCGVDSVGEGRHSTWCDKTEVKS